ncbi:MAG TPA: hypothetical protein VLA39_08400 [Marinobacterium sp.]|nr:hypothetical protein [Marinobacterium sp.]
MLKLGLTLLIVPAVALMAGYMYEQNQIEACVQAGGIWNWAAERCEASGDYPFVPFMTRYPYLVNGGMTLVVMGLLVTLVGLYRPKPPKRES